MSSKRNFRQQRHGVLALRPPSLILEHLSSLLAALVLALTAYTVHCSSASSTWRTETSSTSPIPWTTTPAPLDAQSVSSETGQRTTVRIPSISSKKPKQPLQQPSQNELKRNLKQEHQERLHKAFKHQQLQETLKQEATPVEEPQSILELLQKLQDQTPQTTRLEDQQQLHLLQEVQQHFKKVQDKQKKLFLSSLNLIKSSQSIIEEFLLLDRQLQSLRQEFVVRKKTHEAITDAYKNVVKALTRRLRRSVTHEQTVDEDTASKDPDFRANDEQQSRPEL